MEQANNLILTLTMTLRLTFALTLTLSCTLTLALTSRYDKTRQDNTRCQVWLGSDTIELDCW